MNQALTRQNAISLFTQVAYLAFFTSFICSFRAITSISIAAILLGGILSNASVREFISLAPNKSGVLRTAARRRKGIEQNTNRSAAAPPREIKQLFLIACALFYLLQFIALLYTSDTQAGWDNTRLKSGLLFIPLAVYSTQYMQPHTRKRLFSWYCIILAIASLYCLVIACRNYTQDHSHYDFFYHDLVRPLSQHGVYFSIFVFIALVYLVSMLRKEEFIFSKSLHITLVFFLSFFLLLLSSKIVIVFYGVYLTWLFVSLVKKKTVRPGWILTSLIAIIVTGSVLLLTKNPVSERFNDIFRGDIRFIMQDKFDRSDYFNGVQFRLLQWRLVSEILTENRSWITGVGPGDAQPLLRQQYISKNMYQGDPAKKGSKGYLDYNTHNQFLQSLLQTGLIGALAFLLITFSLIRMAWKSRDTMHIFIIAILVAYSLIESVFETQYGILLYTFFPLFMQGFSSRRRQEPK